MPTIIPFQPSLPRQVLQIQLSGKTYSMRARWNTRAQLWFLNVTEENGAPVFSGAAIVLGAAIGRVSTHQLMMDGVLVARDSTGRDTEATLDTLGTLVNVLYYTRDEMVQEILGDVTGGTPDPST